MSENIQRFSMIPREGIHQSDDQQRLLLTPSSPQCSIPRRRGRCSEGMDQSKTRNHNKIDTVRNSRCTRRRRGESCGSRGRERPPRRSPNPHTQPRASTTSSSSEEEYDDQRVQNRRSRSASTSALSRSASRNRKRHGLRHTHHVGQQHLEKKQSDKPRGDKQKGVRRNSQNSSPAFADLLHRLNEDNENRRKLKHRSNEKYAKEASLSDAVVKGDGSGPSDESCTRCNRDNTCTHSNPSSNTKALLPKPPRDSSHHASKTKQFQQRRKERKREESALSERPTAATSGVSPLNSSSHHKSRAIHPPPASPMKNQKTLGSSQVLLSRSDMLQSRVQNVNNCSMQRSGSGSSLTSMLSATTPPSSFNNKKTTKLINILSNAVILLEGESHDIQ